MAEMAADIGARHDLLNALTAETLTLERQATGVSIAPSWATPRRSAPSGTDGWPGSRRLPGASMGLDKWTAADLKRVAPGGRDDYINALVDGWAAIQSVGIDTNVAPCHFPAQALHETGGFTIVREDCNWSLANARRRAAALQRLSGRAGQSGAFTAWVGCGQGQSDLRLYGRGSR